MVKRWLVQIATHTDNFSHLGTILESVFLFCFFDQKMWGISFIPYLFHCFLLPADRTPRRLAHGPE